MTDEERRALGRLRFNWAPTRDDVWKPHPFHVDGLNDRAMRALREGLQDAEMDDTGSPVGVVLEGRKGAGKTHLLGRLCELAQRQGAYFILVGLLAGEAFWESVLLSYSESLLHPVPGHDSQLHLFVERLLDRIDAPAEIRQSIMGDTRPPDAVIDEVLQEIVNLNRPVGRECASTARALLLCASNDLPTAQEGEQILSTPEAIGDESGADDNTASRERTAHLRTRRISRLLALTGPTVLAIDQMDTLVSESSAGYDVEHERDARVTRVLSHVADGIMELRESTRRTLSVVACLSSTWEKLESKTVTSVPDRFRRIILQEQLPDARVAAALVERRFRLVFDQDGFDPPYPTWPVKEGAFENAWEFSPRQLLQLIDTHINACLDDDDVRELEHLKQSDKPAPVRNSATLPDDVGASLDSRFHDLVERAAMDDAFHPDTEDLAVSSLLTAGLESWVLERGPAAERFVVDPIPGRKPALHARLRQVLDPDTEDERHWAFRAVATANGTAQYHRVRTAITMAGCREGTTRRMLVLLRNERWTNGDGTQREFRELERAGGRRMELNPGDLAVFSALRQLLRDQPSGLDAWLIDRQPASHTTLLADVLGDISGTATPPATPSPDGPLPRSQAVPGILFDGLATPPAESGPPLPRRRPVGERTSSTDTRSASPTDSSSVVLGTSMETSLPVAVQLAALRKHVTLFAGSGSGKTVFIRRIVEECALLGVSAIVLDPNNDLARLGDGWPDPPTGWSAADHERSQEYLTHTDVRIWTPGRDGGNPLSFQPLPDFNAVLSDADELNDAIESAVAALAPRARIDSRTNKADLSQAVLREALVGFAHAGETDLDSFIGYLRRLPDGVQSLGDKGRKAAVELADTLKVATVNDKLFGGTGSPADPGILLTPGPGKRARISVISFIGLRQEAQRQSFVNQLQMALFAWIKANPAVDRPLGGLLVMDEAQTLAPSGRVTACTYSTLALASQARKYGLGLIFATQSPKGLHNQIAGNASTQLFGHLTAPVQINAVNAIARSRGGRSDLDLASLNRGQFHAGLEGHAFEKISTPMCLSHHPPSPLTDEEVLSRAAERQAS